MRLGLLLAGITTATLLAGTAGAATNITLDDRGPLTGPVPVGPAPVVTDPDPAAYGTFNGSVGGMYRSPYDGLPFSQATYFSVGSETTPSTAIFNISGTRLPFLWGSPDSYNTMTFFSGAAGDGDAIASLTGTDVVNSGFVYTPDAGCSSSAGCGYANLEIAIADGRRFESVQLSTTSAAFEGAAAVPLPAAAWLFLSGLAGVGAWARRAKTA